MWLYVVRCGGLYLETLSSCNLFCEVDTVTTLSPLHNSIHGSEVCQEVYLGMYVIYLRLFFKYKYDQ